MTKRHGAFSSARTPGFGELSGNANVFAPAYRPIFDGVQHLGGRGRGPRRRFPKVFPDETPFLVYNWVQGEDPDGYLPNRGKGGAALDVEGYGGNGGDQELDDGVPQSGRAPFMVDFEPWGGDWVVGGPLTIVFCVDIPASPIDIGPYFFSQHLMHRRWTAPVSGGWWVYAEAEWYGPITGYPDGGFYAWLGINHSVFNFFGGTSHPGWNDWYQRYIDGYGNVGTGRQTIMITIDPLGYPEDHTYFRSGGVADIPIDYEVNNIGNVDPWELSYGGCAQGDMFYPALDTEIVVFSGQTVGDTFSLGGALGYAMYRGRGSQAKCDWWNAYDWASHPGWRP